MRDVGSTVRTLPVIGYCPASAGRSYESPHGNAAGMPTRRFKESKGLCRSMRLVTAPAPNR